MIFEKGIALFNQEFFTREEAMKVLADKFIEAGVVEENFYNGLMKREAVFPTGLILDGKEWGVAIPHTDPEYVKETQLGFMTLKEPVTFQFMADPSMEVSVKVIFMMAIKEAHGQVEMLSKLMDMFCDEAIMDKFAEVDNFADFFELIKEKNLDL